MSEALYGNIFFSEEFDSSLVIVFRGPNNFDNIVTDINVASTLVSGIENCV